MKCPKCQHENPDDAKFCNECAKKLELICPECGKANPPGSKFCNECAKNLILPSEPPRKDLSFDEKLDKIQRYLPKGLTDKILSQRDRIEGERKQVTVMFCDMAGYTSLSEKLGPDGTYQLMDKIYELLIHEVHRYGGTVNELTGDGILALFGAPIALEDAPQRAIRSALAIHREIASFSEKTAKERKGIPPLKMRAGIHTGPVVVGTLGNDLRVEFKAVGDTVNLASRMEGLAEPGTTYVTEDTFKLTEGLFRFEALGKKQVKGKREPVLTYRVLGSGRSRSRFEARAEKGLTSFVGRERELEILWDCYERARDGRGQALSIAADAGLGKSRLLYEFRKSLTNEEVTFLEGRCVSYGQNSPYLPVIDLLKDNFRIGIEDGSEEIQEKIKRRLRQVGANLDRTLPYLLELLSLENGFEALRAIDPETKRRKTFESLRDLTLRGSQVRPMVMAFEDMHWIDKTSEESIKFLVDHIAGARVVLIFTFRSNYLPPWGGKSYYSQINLNRLSNRESLHIIKSLLDSEEIEENLAGLILEKAEGVPFFIEEFIRSLLESEAVMRDNACCRLKSDLGPVSIPETLYDLLMARVDRLPEGAKEILQVGSVIEREFSWALIKEVTGLPEMELLSRLSHSKEAELIFERGIFPQVIYIFQHAMTQELLYNSLLAAKQREYHLAIGKAMERLYSDHLEEYSSMLALHFTRGGDPKRGYQYHHLAGDRAAASYANSEALEHFREAWRLIDEWDQDRELLEPRLDTAIKLAEVMEPLGKFEPTLVLLEEVLGGSTGLENPALYAQVHYWMGNTFGNLGRYDDARKFLLRSLKLSQESQSKETEGNAHNYLSQLDFFQGYLRRAMDHAENAVQCLQEIGNPTRLAWALVYKGLILCDLKGEDDCQKVIKEARDWIDRSGNERALCVFYVLNSRTLLKTGQYEAAYKSALEGLELAEKMGEGILTVFVSAYAGLGALYANESDSALRLLQKGEAEGKKLGHPLSLAYVRLALAETLLRLGKIEEAMEPAEAALHFCQELDLGGTLQLALEVNAEILANRVPREETRIDEMTERAATLVKRSDSPWHRINHLMTQTRINLKRGRLKVAQESLSEVRALYQTMGLEEGTEELRSLEKTLRQ
ncbi:MAG: adenylate/guanylate cyclase domain-containing protein [Pseudomonadota bacterium]